ncbi:MAG: transglutaminase domain-containing protein [Paludibacteraceae bacterium]|nr:transglutaminase domain-containing protein [Paludibacteraceae bacterium]
MLKLLLPVLLGLCFLCPGARALPADAYVAVNIPARYMVSLDALASYIRANYNGTEAQLWALYSWEASRLRYNLSKRDVQLNITNPDELALWTLKSGEGVCANFAALFYAVARRLGVEAYLVGGYAVTHNNVRDDGHEWVGCVIEGKPFFFDPTWGGGYMLNDAQYVHRLNAAYFMVKPEDMVRTHMPEDPLFQFLDFPHYYDEIDNPGVDHPVSVYFNWRDSLATYNRQDTLARLGGQLARMRRNGFANDWISGEILRLQHNYEAMLLNRQVDVFNDCVDRSNKLIARVNNLPAGGSNAQILLREVADIRKTLVAMADVLDEVDFSSDALVKGAAKLQQQSESLLSTLSKLEITLNKR